MDGTLTLPVHDFEKIRFQLGIASQAPILEAIEKMPAEQAEEARANLHHLEMELACRAKPQPGVRSVLEKLTDQGKKLGILTRNNETISHATLAAAGLSEFFAREFIISRDDCPPKPSPDGVHLLRRRWQSEKTETIIVGDFLYDIQAGFDAGIETVHFDSTGRFRWPRYTRHKIKRIGDLSFMI